MTKTRECVDCNATFILVPKSPSTRIRCALCQKRRDLLLARKQSKKRYSFDVAYKEKQKKNAKNYYKKNRDHVLARHRLPNNKAKRRIDYQKNAERERRRSKEWIKKTPERIKRRDECNKIYRKNNPDKFRLYDNRKRFKRSNCLSAPYEPQQIFERDKWTCWICKKPVEKERRYPDPLSVSIDHVVPISRGGDDTPENVACAHWICNTRKGAKTLSLW